MRAGGLEWTIVYPPALTNGAATGQCRDGEQLVLTGRASISRADVAEFMLAQLTRSTYSHKAVIIGP